MTDTPTLEWHYAFPDENDKDLISQVCRDRTDRVFISQFPRYGRTKARLILVFWGSRREGLPFLIKKAPIDDVRQELQAIKVMKKYVRDCRLEDEKLFESRNGEYGALLYNHVGDDPEKAENPQTFRDVLFSHDEIFTTDKLEEIVQIVYGKLATAYKEVRKVRQDIRIALDRYFRNDESRGRILHALGSDANNEQFIFLGEKILNPLIFMDSFPREQDLLMCPVHGDLHPDNIVLDDWGQPHLIDFAWSLDPRDILVDFVLLECSVRFWHFPNSTYINEQLEIDRRLLEPGGHLNLDEVEFACIETKRRFDRVRRVISQIRRSAREYLGDDFSHDHYLLIQFCVLYGLLKYDTYDACSGIRALGMIAKKLRDSL